MYTNVYNKTQVTYTFVYKGRSFMMSNEGDMGHHKDRHHRGDGHKHKDHKHGAKTFRRGRALAFLELLNTKRSTLKQQLITPELQSINPILVGELKAIEMVISEFIQVFELHEVEELEFNNQKETSSFRSSESPENGVNESNDKV
ncbi:MAG: hypothetical protein K0S80_3249 [Neobacillus sp.]|nr:hypothetical protein [Neobacillus sp.]